MVDLVRGRDETKHGWNKRFPAKSAAKVGLHSTF